jgi:hypothetical protein
VRYKNNLFLVSPVISRHKKSFKKIAGPRSRPVRPRFEPTAISLSLLLWIVVVEAESAPPHPAVVLHFAPLLSPSTTSNSASLTRAHGQRSLRVVDDAGRALLLLGRVRVHEQNRHATCVASRCAQRRD